MARRTSLSSRIDRVRCKDTFPLKHETLEYSAKHFIDALDYILAGNAQEANFSLNKAILNIETFYDWSVDVKE